MGTPSIKRFVSVRLSGLPSAIWVEVFLTLASEINLRRGVNDPYDPRSVTPFAVKAAVQELQPDFVLVLVDPNDILPPKIGDSTELLNQMEVALREGHERSPVLINSSRTPMLLAGHKRVYTAILSAITEMQAIDFAHMDLGQFDQWLLNAEKSTREKSLNSDHVSIDE